jgi:hypothetical protein
MAYNNLIKTTGSNETAWDHEIHVYRKHLSAQAELGIIQVLRRTYDSDSFSNVRLYMVRVAITIK